MYTFHEGMIFYSHIIWEKKNFFNCAFQKVLYELNYLIWWDEKLTDKSIFTSLRSSSLFVHEPLSLRKNKQEFSSLVFLTLVLVMNFFQSVYSTDMLPDWLFSEISIFPTFRHFRKNFLK